MSIYGELLLGRPERLGLVAIEISQAERSNRFLSGAAKLFMKGSKRTKKRLPLTTLQGILLSLALAVLFALAFGLVIYLYSLPKWSE